MITIILSLLETGHRFKFIAGSHLCMHSVNTNTNHRAGVSPKLGVSPTKARSDSHRSYEVTIALDPVFYLDLDDVNQLL